MASFSMHLAIAKLYLEKHPEEDEDEFIKGTLAPDLTNDKATTHYGKDSAWANPSKYIQENGKSIENNFKRGYFLHLVTDYVFNHNLIDIDELIAKLGLDEWISSQRSDYSILEGEIVDKYQIQDWVDKLPENIRKVMIRAEGELKIFERDSLFKFLEDMAKIDLDKMAEELIKNPEADLINLYNKYCLNEKSA